ncbi:hypothetical protein EYF80_042879 [Liparis tanakae]|uniref:Uncharacterized protein n=1 Tax=Liparis tanakae TaxID=230148 RepID=A0A4Z2G0Y8_9TELE|nr:hypothetical protein EYF80_042879 [Liparis tanakae]
MLGIAGIVDASSGMENTLPKMVRVRTMFFMILSHMLLHRLSGDSTMGSSDLGSRSVIAQRRFRLAASSFRRSRRATQVFVVVGPQSLFNLEISFPPTCGP